FLSSQFSIAKSQGAVKVLAKRETATWRGTFTAPEEVSISRKDEGIILKTQLWRNTQRVCVLLAMIAMALMGSQVSYAATFAAATPQSTAPGGPGALSYFDLARKDCLGTARNTTSKVWFTLANGVLSDVYYPTIDNTNVNTLQYVVTDGSSFTDLQTRDTTYTVQPLSSSGLDCTV